MKIAVYGSGCPTCKKLFELAEKAASEIEGNPRVEYVSGQKGTQKIIELGAMSSPILVVDDKIAVIGFTPDVSRIKAAILKTSKEK